MKWLCADAINIFVRELEGIRDEVMKDDGGYVPGLLAHVVGPTQYDAIQRI